MLHLYLYLKSFEEIRSKCTIDMSKIPSDKLADECDNVMNHHPSCILFLGFLEVGWMLDPKHEARLRRIIRKFETHLVCFHLDSLPYSWKNEIHTLYTEKPKDGSSEIVNNGGALHDEPKNKHEFIAGKTSSE